MSVKFRCQQQKQQPTLSPRRHFSSATPERNPSTVQQQRSFSVRRSKVEADPYNSKADPSNRLFLSVEFEGFVTWYPGSTRMASGDSSDHLPTSPLQLCQLQGC